MDAPGATQGAGAGPAEEGGRRRRLFFSLWPDDARRVRLARAMRPPLEGVGGRHVPASRLHLTLVFLGGVPSPAIDCLRAAAASVRLAPFELVFDRIDYWRNARVLWLGPRPEPALDTLHGALRTALVPCAVPLEGRDFHPHVTLVRRLPRRPRTGPFDPVAWRVEGFSLIESHSTTGGMEYTEIGAWPLSGNG